MDKTILIGTEEEAQRFYGFAVALIEGRTLNNHPVLHRVQGAEFLKGLLFTARWQMYADALECQIETFIKERLHEELVKEQFRAQILYYTYGKPQNMFEMIDEIDYLEDRDFEAVFSENPPEWVQFPETDADEDEPAEPDSPEPSVQEEDEEQASVSETDTSPDRRNPEEKPKGISYCPSLLDLEQAELKSGKPVNWKE